MRVLVTGGAGFIGSHVVDACIRAGHEPRIFDLRPSPHHSSDDVETVVGDLRDHARLVRAMRGCDAVLHLAAAADVGEVKEAPVESEDRNARCTLHVLEAAREAEVKRVVYASTIWVYSDVVADEVDEDTPLRPPAHLYSATKLAGELYCRSYQELYGVEYTVLRFGIPYGPRARPAAVVPQFVMRALRGEKLTVAGDGSQSRAFVYVEDLAEGVVAALAPVAANRVYNLASRTEVTIAEIAQTVQDVVAPVGIDRVPGRAGDFKGAAVNADRAERELGWVASTPFREGLRRYVEWHVADEATSAVPERRPSRRPSLARLVGTALVALWAVMALLGLAALDPMDEGMGHWAPLLLAFPLLVPLLIAVGLPRVVRPACWGLAATELAVAILPWPGPLGRVGDHHQVLLLVAALSALAVSDMATRTNFLRPQAERS
jgi:UDP-glucose 4-epimerase